jgi:RNA polymerase-binding protein DksA
MSKSTKKHAAPAAGARRRATAGQASSQKKAPAKRKAGARASAAKGAAKKTAATKKATARAGDAKAASKGGAGSKRGGRAAPATTSNNTADKGYVIINGRRVRMISTPVRVVPRREKTETLVPAPRAEDKLKKPLKTRLTRKELRHFRDLLLEKRRELMSDVNSLESEALRSSGGDLSHMPIHMADIGSDTYEQDFMLGLAETERSRVREIDEALQRIDDGSYGICEMTGEPIPTERLEAKPWAKYTIEAARILERGWGG